MTEDFFNRRTKKKPSRKPYGWIRLMSVLEPEPGLVGFSNVISTKVQPSPLNLQPPVGDMIRKRPIFRKYVER